MKIATRTQYLQLAVLSKSQFESVLMWAIAGIVTAAISIVMAFPAAIKVANTGAGQSAANRISPRHSSLACSSLFAV